MAKRSGLPWWSWAPILPLLLSLLLLLKARRRTHPGTPASTKVDSIPLASRSEPPAILIDPEPQSAPHVPDDLTILKGVGLKTAALLQAQGITTYKQLAETPVARLEEILRGAGMRIVNPATWPEQAAQLVH